MTTSLSNGASTLAGDNSILDNSYETQGKLETDLSLFLKGRIAAIVHESEFEVDDHPVRVIDANEPRTKRQEKGKAIE